MEAEQEFDVAGFEKKLNNLKDTQDSIQGLSAWCLKEHPHHKKIVSTWLNVLKQVKVESRLTLFYLANDVIQHSKRKNYGFVESWGTALQRATTMVRDDKVKHKILRIFKIWGERQVYDEDFLSDLNGLLSATLPKPKPKEITDPDEFQISTVVTSIRECVTLQNETDKSLKSVIKSVLPEVPKSFKDRAHCATLKKQIDDDVRRHERYIHNLKAEIKARSLLIAALQQADEFYQTQKGEVKVVANAYKNFGNRIKNMKKKLDDLTTTLPSPIPSPDINAPSPGPETDFDLPADGNFPVAFSSNGFMGYLDGSLPFDPMDFNRKTPSPTVKSIQVINSNTPTIESFGNQNSSINDFFKSLIPDAYDPGANNLSFNEYSMNSSSGSYTGVPAPSSAPLPSYAPITMSNYGMTGNSSGFNRVNNYTGQVPPPPMPPQMESTPSPGYNNWEPTWNPRQDTHSSNPLLDTPHSPPQYERKAVNPSTPIEYVDMEPSSLEAGGDVDHRSLTDILATRTGDIDHRNLISLTGSPGETDVTPSKVIGDKLMSEDIDFRKHLFNLQAPPPPKKQDTDNEKSNKSGDADFRLPPPDLDGSNSTNLEDGGLNIDFSGFNPSLLPPILEPPSLGDLAKLLGTNKNVGGTDNSSNTNSNIDPMIRKKLRNLNGNDDNDAVDMEMSDEDLNLSCGDNSPGQGDGSQGSEMTSHSYGKDSNVHLHPPPIPAFNFDQWNNSDSENPDGSNNGGSMDDQNNSMGYGGQDQQDQWGSSTGSNQQWGLVGQRLLQMSQTVTSPGFTPRQPLMPMPPSRHQMYNHGGPGFNHPGFNNRGRGRGMINRGGGMNMRGSPYFRGGSPRGPFPRGNFRGGPPPGRW